MSIQDAISQRTGRLEVLRELRREAAAEIDRLIDFLDQTDSDPDLEPSLGAPEQSALLWTQCDQRHWAGGAADDREDDPSDDEPSVGFDEEGDVLDRGEFDPADYEPEEGQ